MTSVLVVIPLYNHGATVRAVAESALRHVPDVMVVDDGSSDGGAETLDDLPVVLVRQPRNLGKGAAILRAADEAGGFTHIIVMDADGQHSADDLPRFLQEIQSHPCALIIGARNFDTPNVPAASRFGRKFSGFWMLVQTGLAVSDMQSGFRAYPLALLQAVRCSESGYAFEVEIVVRAAWAGFDIREIPISVHYPPASERVSHFRPLFDNARLSLLNTRLTIRALLPVPFRRRALEVEGPPFSLFRPREAVTRLLQSPGATPAVLAASAAWSLFLSTLPLPGLQAILLLLVIQRRKLNRIAALLLVPLTWPPFVPGLAVLLGHRLRNGFWLTQFDIQTLGYQFGSRLLDWVAGSLALAPLLAVVGAGAVYALARFCELGLRPRPRRGSAPVPAGGNDSPQTPSVAQNASLFAHRRRREDAPPEGSGDAGSGEQSLVRPPKALARSAGAELGGAGEHCSPAAGVWGRAERPQSGKNWSSKSLGGAWQHEFFRLIVRLRLVGLARLLLFPVSFSYALRPAIRERYGYYLRRRFPEAGAWRRFWQTARAYKNFADGLLDRMVYGVTGEIALTQHWGTLETLERLLADGRGCLLVSAHFGSWQVGLAGLETLGRPIHLVQWVDEGDVDRHYFQRGKGHDISIINPRDGVRCGIEILNALKHNDIVCFMGDRLTPNDRQWVEVDFLGGRVRLPAAPWVLAAAARSPVLHTFCVRQGGRITGLAPLLAEVPPDARRHPEALAAAGQRFADCLEELTRTYPFHFFNFYDMWNESHDQKRTC